MDPLSITLIAGTVLATLGTAAFAGLKGWNAWLELKRMEITHTMSMLWPNASWSRRKR